MTGSVSACLCCNCWVSLTPPLSAPGTAAVPPLALRADQAPPFFSQELEEVFNWNFHCEEQCLVETKKYNDWTISSCILCKTGTHAVSNVDPRRALIPVASKMELMKFKELKKSKKCSNIFKMVLEEPKEAASIKKFSGAFSHPAAESLNKRLIKAIEKETEKVEEDIRLFRDRKLEELEIFKERAQSDHRIALSMLADNESVGSEFTLLQNTKPFNYLAANKPKSIIKTLKTDSKNTSGPDSLTEDSLDSEEMFQFEGVDSSVVQQNGQISDVYDSESEDSVSHDEGIHITRHDQQYSSIAKSLPINVPTLQQLNEAMHEDQKEEYPRDIAASIKALARSVHGDVFDLPRPRFSTQI